MIVLVLDLWAAIKVTQSPLRPPLTISSSLAIKAGRVACVVVGSALIALALKFRSFVHFFSVEYNALNEHVVWLFGTRQPVRGEPSRNPQWQKLCSATEHMKLSSEFSEELPVLCISPEPWDNLPVFSTQLPHQARTFLLLLSWDFISKWERIFQNSQYCNRWHLVMVYHQ